MDIALIGTGNMAWQLTHAFTRAGVPPKWIFGRNQSALDAIASIAHAKPVLSGKGNLPENADLVIIAVRDDAIGEVADQLPATRAVICHTSGSVSLDVVSAKHPHAGVFYPLQTMTKNKPVDFSSVPLCLEWTDDFAKEILFRAGSYLTQHIHVLDSAQRLIVHLSAVIANNFVNHLLAHAKTLLAQHHISPEILNPLIRETMEKALDNNPADIQTGPAKRNDIKTIEKHLEQLKSYPELHQLYRQMTDSIRKMFNR